MLVDRDAPEDVFARVPELAANTDPVPVRLNGLLEDDELFGRVRTDLARRFPLTACHGRHSTPAEAILRLLVVQHLYAWSYRETARRVGDGLVLRWFCRVYFRRVPDATTLLAMATHGPGELVRYPMGEQLFGRLAYDAAGTVSVHIMRPGRPAYASGDPVSPSADEAAAAASGYLAYWGTYAVDEDAGTVSHAIECALFPNWVGSCRSGT